MSSSSTFTPGPWEVERSVMGCRSVIAGDALIASVEDAPQTANATLIAAAPELYEALDKLLASSGARQRYHAHDYVKAVEKAEALLVRVRGDA